MLGALNGIYVLHTTLAAFDADDDEAATPFHTSHIAKLILDSALLACVRPRARPPARAPACL